MVWALPISLAATFGIDVSFSSSGYLDVSVRRVPGVWLWIHHTSPGGFPGRFPHSDISGSMDICSSPKLFAAYHVFHRLLVPRHPPYALSCLTLRCIALHLLGLFPLSRPLCFQVLSVRTSPYGLGCLDICFRSVCGFQGTCGPFRIQWA